MNCDYYREQLLADPTHRSARLRQHLKQCTECQQYALQVEIFEEGLRRAIQTPAGESVSLPELPAVSLRPRRWVGAAAAIVALLLLMIWTFRPDAEQHEALAVTSDILHHMAGEPQAFASTEAIDPDRLLAVMGAKLEVEEGWHATYADPCKIRGIPGLHLVYRNGKEVATVIILPGRLPVDESHVAARYSHGMTVVVVPSSPTRPKQLLASLDPVLYPL